MFNRNSSDLEARLSSGFNMDALTPHLDSAGRKRYAELALCVKELICKANSESIDDENLVIYTMGTECALSEMRNYMMAVLTANAVIEARNRLERAVTVAELGVGSGLNAVAAFLADPDTKYIGWEKDAASIDFANRLLQSYGFDGKAVINKRNFLHADYSGIDADVVINENLSPMLLEEPQLEASQAILLSTHDKTVFVPGGVDVYLRLGYGEGQTLYFGRIDFGKRYESPIILAAEIDSNRQNPWREKADCILDLLNFDFKPISTDRCDVPMEGLYLRNPIKVSTPECHDEWLPHGRYTLILRFDFPPKNCCYEGMMDIMYPGKPQ